jgi:cytochrome c
VTRAYITTVVLALLLLAGCRGTTYQVATGGDAGRGKQLIVQYSCGSCHTIPGVKEAKGYQASPLLFFNRRAYIAGQVPNTPDNLVRWIVSPQSIEAGTAMPALGVSEEQARDIAAYLYNIE